MKDEHIGDGVYASFDGYYINLAVNHHTNYVIALEPSVLRSLILYARAVDDENNAKHFGV